MGIKEVLHRIIVGGGGYNYKIRIFIGRLAVKCGGQVQIFLSKVFFDIFILNGRDTIVDFLYLFGDYVYSGHLVVLRQKGRNTETDITGTGYSYLYFIKIAHYGKYL